MSATKIYENLKIGISLFQTLINMDKQNIPLDICFWVCQIEWHNFTGGLFVIKGYKIKYGRPLWTKHLHEAILKTPAREYFEKPKIGMSITQLLFAIGLQYLLLSICLLGL